MSDILLSIAIPTRNRYRYLSELLPELLSECEKADGSGELVEIVISDNASTDETREYVQNMAKQNRRIKYFRNGENIGGDLNFIKVIERANGKYVWLFGDDELIEKNAIVKVIRVIEKYKCKLIIAKDANDCLKFGSIPKFFKSYGALVRFMSKINPYLFVGQSLITMNIFLKESFDITYAKSMISTNYAHMYTLINGLKSGGSVYLFDEPLIRIRKERAPLQPIPKFLQFKIARYLYYIGKTYGSINMEIFAFFFFITRLFLSTIYTIRKWISYIPGMKKVYKMIKRIYLNKR